MATPADNLDRIADLAGEIRDFTYNSSISLDFIDVGIGELGTKLDTIANNIGTGFASARIENDISDMRNFSANQLNMLDVIFNILEMTWKSSNMNFAEVQKLLSNNNKNNNNQGPAKKEAKPEKLSINSFLDSLKGGIVTATVEGMKQLIAASRTIYETFKSKDPAKILSGTVNTLASIPSIFTSIVDMASKFVSALDPALMAQLGLTFQDLMATVGIGLRPIIQAVIPIVRAFADTLTPVMNNLAPVMQQFGSAMIQIAIPVIAIWANAINYLIPVIESLIPLFIDIAEILSFISPVFNLFFDALSRGINFVLGIFHTFMVGIKAITVALLEAAAWITSWVSKSGAETLKGLSTSVQSSMERSMEAQAGAFGKWLGPSPKKPVYTQGASVGAAAKQASFSGIAELGKNMMQAAFGQSAQNAALETANNTKDMAEGMKQLVGWALGQGNENRAQRGVRN